MDNKNNNTNIRLISLDIIDTMLVIDDLGILINESIERNDEIQRILYNIDNEYYFRRCKNIIIRGKAYINEGCDMPIICVEHNMNKKRLIELIEISYNLTIDKNKSSIEKYVETVMKGFSRRSTVLSVFDDIKRVGKYTNKVSKLYNMISGEKYKYDSFINRIIGEYCLYDHISINELNKRIQQDNYDCINSIIYDTLCDFLSYNRYLHSNIMKNVKRRIADTIIYDMFTDDECESEVELDIKEKED